MRRFAYISCIGLLALGSAGAQEFSKFSFDIGGGYTMPVGATSNVRDPGWNVEAGAGFNFSPHFGAMIDLGYDSLGTSSSVLISDGATNGDINVFHATFDPVARMHVVGRLNFYLTAGGGLFHRTRDVEFASFPGITHTVNKPGFDVGGGLEYGVLARGKFFTEAKWEHVFGDYGVARLDMIPVSFGFRW